MRLQYPFVKANGMPYSSKELFDILATEQSGYYLLSSYDFWHGGVHFTDQVDAGLKNTPVRAIADGTVVAYRINKHYPVVDVDNPEKKQCEYYRYSTSFCLVKHAYNPTVEENPILHTPVAPATPQGWAGKAIVFERNVIARNPDIKTDQDTGYTTKVEIPSGSKATITAVDADGYATAVMTYFGENIVYSGDLGKRDAKVVTGLDNNKEPNPNPIVIELGEPVYFQAFKDKIMLGAGRGLFTEDVNTPQTPASNTADSTTDTTDTTDTTANASNALTFYSLYMHLLAFEAYEGKAFVKVIVSSLDERNKPADGASTCISSSAPPVKDVTIYEVVGQKSNEGFVFLLGYRANEKGDRTAKTPVWFKEASKKVDGKSTPYVKAHTIKDIDARKDTPAYWLEDAKIEATVLADERQILTYKKDATQSPLRLEYAAELKKGSIFTYDPLSDKQTQEVTLVQLTAGGVSTQTKSVTYMKCQLIKAVDSSSVANTFYLLWDDTIQPRLSLRGVPNQFDEVVNCNVPVKVGDILGYLGQYETPIDRDGGIKNKHQIHFEIFTTEAPAQLKKFLDNTANLKTGRRYVRVDKGTEVVFAENPPKANEVANIPAENRLALTHLFVRPITELVMSKDDQDQMWLCSQEFDSTAKKKGWVKENAAGVQVLTQHDLTKLGFTPVEEKNKQATGYNETGEIWGGSNEVSAFFNDIYNKIMADGVATPEEIRQALENPQVADQMRKIVSYHPSEWKRNAKLIDTLETVGRKYEEHHRNLLYAEIDKMENMVFWDEVDGLKGIDRAHFFHPIAFIQHLGPNVEKPIRIAIDAGHGGTNLTNGKRTPPLPILTSGDSWDFKNLGRETVYEWEFNDVVARFVAEELKSYQGVEVIRVDDETGREIDVALADRPKKARDWEANHYLAIHHNAFGDAKAWYESDYIVIFIHRNTDGGKHLTRSAAQLAADGIASETAMNIRKRPTGNGVNLCGYQVLREFYTKPTEVAIYTEAGFMDSKKNIRHMLDSKHKLDIKRLRGQAKAIANAYATVLNLIKL